MDNIVDLGRFKRPIPIIEGKPVDGKSFSDGEDADDYPVYEFTYAGVDPNVPITEVVAGLIIFTPTFTGVHVGTDPEGNMIFNFLVPNHRIISVKQVEFVDE